MNDTIDKMHPVVTTAHAHVIAMMLYAANVGRGEQIGRLFPENHPSYKEELMERLTDSFPSFWFSLDSGKQREYLSHALDAYGESGSDMANRAMAVASGFVA